MHQIFITHLPVNGHLACFRILATINSAAVNIGVMYLLNYLFLDICPGVGLLDHMVTLILVFKGTSVLFSIVAVPIAFLPTV